MNDLFLGFILGMLGSIMLEIVNSILRHIQSDMTVQNGPPSLKMQGSTLTHKQQVEILDAALFEHRAWEKICNAAANEDDIANHTAACARLRKTMVRCS